MHTLGENISGKIFLDPLNGGSSGYSIGVKASEGYRRKRFTIAHEIAHFILHRSKIGDELVDDAMYRSGLSTREEAQANQLAADILMPRKLIKELQSRGFTDVSSLADELEVSEAAIKVRLSYV
jgi:Zn-dependent peptidase ImmA (M78 family)